MYKVYKHTAPNGKVYIGITAQSVNNRWRNGNGYNHSPHFKSAIIKYGWDNIKHEILYSGLTKDEAEQKEIELIELYQSTNPAFGYNCDSGGNANKLLSEETKNKIRLAHIGMKYDRAFCEKQSALKKGNKNRLGQTQSKTCRKKISEKNKGRFSGEKNYFFNRRFCGSQHPNAKAVEKYDKDGNFIETKDCAEDFAKEMKLHNAAHITEVCRGQRRTAYGFIWRYKGEI